MGDGGCGISALYSLSPDVNDMYWNNVLRDPMPDDDDDDDDALGAMERPRVAPPEVATLARSG